MAKKCFVCGKGPVFGYKVSRRGLAKSKGGVGLKITGITSRKISPNIQRVKANIKGAIKTINVCTRCLKANKVKKAV